MTRRRPGVALALVAVAILAILALTTTSHIPHLGAAKPHMLHDEAVENFVRTAVHNTTLGFGATILISLKSRTDRRDSLALISAAHGVNITHTVDAVRGEEIVDRAKPVGKAKSFLNDVHWGSWRSHLDALRWVVESGVETALILEDDVDWDVYVHDQFLALANGLRSSPLRDSFTTHELLSAPYGLDWDVLHLGPSSFTPAPSPLSAVHTTYPDPNTSPQMHCGATKWFCWRTTLDAYSVPTTSRLLLPSYEVLGLAALAVTQSGARRLLFELGVRQLDDGMDWGVANLLIGGRAKGWTVLPPLFSSWRSGGPADSDINSKVGKNGAKAGGAGSSPGLAWSARVALRKEMEGGVDGGRWTKERWAGFMSGLVEDGGNEEGNVGKAR